MVAWDSADDRPSKTKFYIVRGLTLNVNNGFKVGTIVKLAKDDYTTSLLFKDIEGNTAWVPESSLEILSDVPLEVLFKWKEVEDG